jgi:hypothetical protein
MKILHANHILVPFTLGLCLVRSPSMGCPGRMQGFCAWGCPLPDDGRGHIGIVKFGVCGFRMLRRSYIEWFFRKSVRTMQKNCPLDGNAEKAHLLSSWLSGSAANIEIINTRMKPWQKL